MRKTYGNTWWGKQWLNALRNIDWSNRLPRGRSYANRGLVKEVNVSGKSVKAKVQGSRRTPYKQRISVRQFSAKEKQHIIRLITENPFILSQLLNRELPEQLYGELEKERLRLFPTSWEDMQATCSCPDWAVPCKHIAAVIYLIANEIDRNPFRVFLLRGLDILKEIQQLGFTATGNIKSNVVRLNDLFVEKTEDQAFSFSHELMAEIDFSRIPECGDELLKLLPARPVFYPGKDFRQLFARHLKQIAKNARNYQVPEAQYRPKNFPHTLDSVCIRIDSEFQYKDTILETDGIEQSIDNSEPGLAMLCAELGHIHPKDFSRLPPSMIALYLIYEFTLHLLQKRAVIPRVVEIESDLFRLQWLPALLNEEVKHIFGLLCKLSPPEILLIDTDEGLRYLEREEQTRTIIACFIENFILEFLYADIDNKLISFFFFDFVFEIESFEDKELPFAIQQWLQKFYLAQKDYMPVIKVSENDPDFELSFWIENKKDMMAPLVSLEDLFEKKIHLDKRLKFLQDLALLAEYLPEVQSAIRSKGRENVYLNAEDFVKVLLETVPALGLLGIKILLPKALQKIARPQLSMLINENRDSSKEQTYLSLKKLLKFDWQVALGDQVMDPNEFLQQTAGLSGIVKIRDTYVLIDDKEIQTLLKQLKKPTVLTGSEILQAGLGETYKDAKVQLSKEARIMIRELLKKKKIKPPSGLLATLRPYQQSGYEWLYKNTRIGFGSLLADDMGLGKTVQVIALLVKMKLERQLVKKKALVVVPTSLLTNWQNEISKFAPQLQTHIYHGPARKLENESNDLVITTYGVIRSDIQKLEKISWAAVVIDEAQNIKNPSTAQTKSVKKLKAEFRIAMSGTPVENRLSEYWSIFDFTNKGYLGSLNNFKKTFIQPIELDRDRKELKRFKAITSPFILRRLKTDKSIIDDLPDKISNDVICALSPQQLTLYQAVVDLNLKDIDENEGIARRGMIFKLMTALKQICNHPSHYMKKESIDPMLSGKSGTLLSLMDNIYENGEKALIFTQYKEMGNLLVKLLEARYDCETLFLHGSLTRKKRDTVVEKFQEKPYVQAMVLSLKAGGTGLNLTAANHVIHYDLWWNPAVESQATDRAFRIGQKRNVWVYRLITQGTFEEKINEMINQKRELADLTVSTGENWIGELSNRELGQLFRL